jgi:hypothetical protein
MSMRVTGGGTPDSPERCFSLVTGGRMLDLEAEDRRQRDWFVAGFRELLGLSTPRRVTVATMSE